MSRFGILAVVCVCVAVLVPAASRAALDFSSPADAASDLEIVVVEAPDCIYCHLFRRDVWPFYENSQRAKKVPMRFADLNSETMGDLDLAAPIESVPTAILLQQNKELGRIPGYVGPENFFHTIDRLLASAP
jgi:thioredoxin-related protein